MYSAWDLDGCSPTTSPSSASVLVPTKLQSYICQPSGGWTCLILKLALSSISLCIYKKIEGDKDLLLKKKNRGEKK